MRHKVLAYITRGEGPTAELLVFSHRDHPEAGVQVPGGTVDPGEHLETALRREIYEESGLVNVRVIGPLARRLHVAPGQTRSAYLVEAIDDTPDAWQHMVFGQGQDAGLTFCYRWVPVAPPPELAGFQSRWLPLVQAAVLGAAPTTD